MTSGGGQGTREAMEPFEGPQVGGGRCGAGLGGIRAAYSE